MRKSLFITLSLTIIAVSMLLFLRSEVRDVNKQKNGFQRVALTGFATFKKEIIIPTGLARDICGISNQDVFLTTRNANLVIDVNIGNGKIDSIDLKLPVLPLLNPVFYSTIQYPEIFILAGDAHKIIRGNIEQKKYEILAAGEKSFGNGLMINPRNFLFRAIDTSTRESLITLFNVSNQQILVEHNITTRHADIGISSAGHICIDTSNAQLAFVARHSNDIILFDTNLQVIRRARSIDTFHNEKVTIAHRISVITHAVPPITINKRAKLFEGYLWVQSAVKADNDSFADFKKEAVFDLYDGSSVNYLGSVYLPYPPDQIRDFAQIGEGKAVLLLDKSIVIYHFEKALLKSLLQ